jgi:hypothetical protein
VDDTLCGLNVIGNGFGKGVAGNDGVELVFLECLPFEKRFRDTVEYGSFLI